MKKIKNIIDIEIAKYKSGHNIWFTKHWYNQIDGGLYRYGGSILEFYYTNEGIHLFVNVYINRDKMKRHYIDTFDVNSKDSINKAIQEIMEIMTDE